MDEVIENPQKYGLEKQKPVEWSEEDNRMLEASILFVKNSLYSYCEDTLSGEISRNDVQEWLKSLKDRV